MIDGTIPKSFNVKNPTTFDKNGATRAPTLISSFISSFKRQLPSGVVPIKTRRIGPKIAWKWFRLEAGKMDERNFKIEISTIQLCHNVGAKVAT